MFRKIIDLFRKEPENPKAVVVLRDERTDTDTRWLEASFSPSGDLVIRGTDWGDEVEKFWGEREYEWAWTIKTAEIPKLKRTLGAEDVLGRLKARFSNEHAADLGEFLAAHDILYESWSRTGD